MADACKEGCLLKCIVTSYFCQYFKPKFVKNGWLAVVVFPAGIKVKRVVTESTATEKVSIKNPLSNKSAKEASLKNTSRLIDETAQLIQKIAKPGVRIRKVDHSEDKSPDDKEENGGDSEEIDFVKDDDSDEDYTPKRQYKTRQYKKDIETKVVDEKKKVPKQQTSVKTVRRASYVCIMCGESFPSFDILSKHMRSTISCRQEQVIICPICEKGFKTRARCNAHLNTHKEKPKYPCTKCGKEFPNTIALRAHLETMHTSYFDATMEAFACKLCDKQAPTKQQILHHINTRHCHVTTFLCDICGKSFWKESSLRAHSMIHTDSKPYMCQICSKSFKLSSSLRAHIHTHNQERRFVCEECGKTFKKNASLSEHKKHHVGEFPFQCDICEKKFVSRSAQNSHMKGHTYAYARDDDQ